MTPVFAKPENRERLLLELTNWLGTPWAHMAAVAGTQTAIRGVGGDCKTILATIYANAGFIEPLQFPAHGVAPGLTAEGDVEASVVKYLQKFVDDGRMIHLDARHTDLLTGDVLTFRWGARDHHLGAACVLSTGTRYVFHAPRAGHKFMLSPLQEWAGALRSAYRLMEVAA